MTARPQLDERDPAEPQEWREMSSPGIRRHVLAQTAAAVAKAKSERGDKSARTVEANPEL